MSMTVFPFPADRAENSEAFSVVGFDWEHGTPEGELLVLPEGAAAPPFSGPIWSPVPQPLRPGLLCPAAAAPAGQPVWLPCSASGRLSDDLRQAAAVFGARLWLYLEPQAALYRPPCSGSGQALSAAELAGLCAAHASFFSPELLCRCCHWAEGSRLSVLLFDTEQTLSMKLSLAASLGIPYVFGPFRPC